MGFPGRGYKSPYLGLLDGGKLKLDNFDERNSTSLEYETYEKIYKIMMEVSYKEHQPARGWPEAVPKADGNACSNNLLQHIQKGANKIFDEYPGYKDTQDESYCEFSEELGIWHNCQNQAYHSVNPRCDPRFWFYAEQIIKENSGIFE